MAPRNGSIATTTISAGHFETLYSDLESVADLRHKTYVGPQQRVYIY